MRTNAYSKTCLGNETRTKCVIQLQTRNERKTRCVCVCAFVCVRVRVRVRSCERVGGWVGGCDRICTGRLEVIEEHSAPDCKKKGRNVTQYAEPKKGGTNVCGLCVVKCVVIRVVEC